ncbi:helix-turn-helix domain-containing protein [Actinomadura rugatobispora]|uniref:Transposase family protein n=1 Tax=Actinomadura rugatobispora TaxID=1994 RepID=A0ABW0ZQ60_9ACTN|nr:hypothetical protein GCM10010200_001370 [Actinomadura rugatobispora]
MQPISAANTGAIQLFTGSPPDEFTEIVTGLERAVGEEVADGLPGRQWSLPLADRVLLVAVYYRTDATVRQLGAMFGVTRPAAGRVLARLGPLLALQPLPQRRMRIEKVLITPEGVAFVTDDARAGKGRAEAPGAILLNVDTGTRLVLRVPVPQD